MFINNKRAVNVGGYAYKFCACLKIPLQQQILISHDLVSVLILTNLLGDAHT